MGMVVDVGVVKNHIKPKADSTLYNMRKADLIEYIRTLEHNYNVAVSFNENQARYIESLGVSEVVRCEKCVHCVNDEEEPGMCKCVESAEYDSESGLWLGFVEYHTPDFFCAYGERKDYD